MKKFSYIINSHPEYIEELYKDFKKDPSSVQEDVKLFFEGFDFAINSYSAHEQTLNRNEKNNLDLNKEKLALNFNKEIQVYRLILGYRNKGHLIAKTNPIRARRNRNAELELSFFNLSEADFDTPFQISSVLGLKNATLKEILNFLKKSYASSIGVEYKYISNKNKIEWIRNKIELEFNIELPLEKKRRILEKLNQAVIFENFLHKKFIGQKRFSLEGGENTIPALDSLIEEASKHNVKELIIGMAHRGRLNVLANILGKTYESIFFEFEGTRSPNLTMGSGDVKYHLGFSSEISTSNGSKMYLKLLPNPSHLEAVDPVVLGYARATADQIYDSDFSKIIPVLIHGDASIAGQGIIYEIAQMSKLKGYYTGGTIHFVINNQIGFTTDFDDARSSDYCTSIASTIQAPVLHVNGDNPEAVLRCMEFAVQYRQFFKSDIFIDMVCYRKHGHNEGDDPKYTQSQLYKLIEGHKNVKDIYVEELNKTQHPEIINLVKEMEKMFWDELQERLTNTKQEKLSFSYQPHHQIWRNMLTEPTESDILKEFITSISPQNLHFLFEKIMYIPDDFQPNPKILKLLEDKKKLFENLKIDWATAELLAYASLLNEGKTVRISGQDVQRGTFSHRQSMIYDEINNRPHNRLHFFNGTSNVDLKIYNSPLNEYAVLGFEYGYALCHPDALIIWEAQFGDFTNGAQTIIDQFIASGEQKWQRQNGLVLFLPHGYEGQGPEHSSARIERFLQLAAENNLIITNVTTAANLFHLLRRQLIWNFRKPLVNFTPKANLRNPYAYSNIKDFTHDVFKPVIDDSFITNKEKVEKILLCTGKIYFDLFEKQLIEKDNKCALIRIEQLYPLPNLALKEIFETYPKYNSKQIKFYWVQEEPLNMGAASYLIMNLKFIKFGIISRKPSASVATGFIKTHYKEQQDILITAFKV